MPRLATCSKVIATNIGTLRVKIKKHLNFTGLRKKLSEVFQSIPDWRQQSKVNISIHDAMMSNFACMYFQDPSLLQFQKRMQEEQHRNNLNTLFGVEDIPKETQMREINDGVDSEYLRPIFKDYYMRLQRGKHLEQFQIFPGLYYFPIDGSQFFGSNDIHCEQCLVKEHQNGSVSYSHQVLQGGIMHPDCSEVIPFMPEQIVNTDGSTKQDCEMNAAKRFVEKLHQEFPQLGLLLGGDALFSKQPIIEGVLYHNMHYLFAAKPDDHKYMMEWLDTYIKLNHFDFIDEKGRLHHYEWMNDVPLNGNKDTIIVNFLRCTISGKNKKGEEEILYKNSWVTDLLISEDNIKTLVKAGRCRWKNENECFNVMKNHGYCMEHSYGHGQKNMAFNFYLLTLLAFFIHQIFELTDRQYQACRKKLGSKKHLWETIRSYIKIIVFDTWEVLLEFVLVPTSYRLLPLDSSP
jgi:hypothetical protein